MTDRSGIEQLVSLRTELNEYVDRLTKSDDAFPSLDSLDSPVVPPSATIQEATVVVEDLLALLQGSMKPFEVSWSFHLPSALRIAIETHVVETLREAAAKGVKSLTAEELAKSSTIDPSKLARILRLLAANRILVETEPDSFALNRPALFLDTGKSVDELKSTKHPFSGTNGVAALIDFITDSSLKSAGVFTETLLDPKTSHSTSVAETASVRAHKLDGPIWEHFAKPGNEHLASRFAAAMRAVHMLGGASSKAGFPFHELPEGTVLVDVGSGVGGASLIFARNAPQINLVLQDRAEVINGEAQTVWAKEAPEDIKSGRVKLTVHDFFNPQPVKGADIYFFRVVIHDWADEYAIKILRHQADAATPSSRLILQESAIDYVPPSGRVPSVQPYFADAQMLMEINGQERTKEQYEQLGRKAGWELVKVWKTGEGGKDGHHRFYEFKLAEEKQE